jgi:uncharacterized protein (TIGR03032 family)
MCDEYILREQDKVLNTHFCDLEKPMGIAANGERLSVGTGFQLLEYRNLPAVADVMASVKPYDACYLPRSIHITGNIDIHELGYATDGELWLVNTRMSCLCTIDSSYSVVPRWKPSFITAYDLTDRCHLNGMGFKDGKPTFVTALGQTNNPGGWRANKASGGLLMNIQDNTIVATGLSMPHSPRWYRDQLWYLESGTGRLCTINTETGVQTDIVQLPGFTRGLDFVGRYAFVGLSQVRETAVFSGLPLTAQPGERHCGVWVVDIETGDIIACVIFTGSVQEVFAIQILPYRFPILLEFDDPLLRNSYSLPDNALAELAAPNPLTDALERAVQKHQEQHFEAAIAGYREVLAQAPEHDVARYHLGSALADAGHWQEAEREFLQVVASQPAHAEAHNSLGLCFAAQEYWEPALFHFDQALLADGQYIVAHTNKAMVLLKLGRYTEGWGEYEWRLQIPEFNLYACPQPRWQGEDISEKVLLVYSEQGDGDTLQFCRFLQIAAQRCTKLLLACTESLRPLLSTVNGLAEARTPDAIPLDSFDYYCSLMSLPHILGVTLESIPAVVPYLKVPDYIRMSYLNLDKMLRIGVYWKEAHSSNSCPLQYWSPLFTVQEVSFYNLRTPISSEDSYLLKALGVINLESELSDYTRTAAFIKQLDIVITTDNSIVHLAGALDKQVWVLLGQHSGWRWLLDCENSPWYPSVRLFRKNHTEDWQTLIERVSFALLETIIENS